MECLNFLTHTPLAWSRHASSYQKRVLSTNWRAAQKGEYCPDGARLSCHVPSPRFRYDAQRGGGRGGVLAGGCHARLRVGPSGFGCGRARTLGFEVYLVGRGRSLLIVLFFFFLIITSTTTTTTIRCGVEIENSLRWSDLERHIPFVRFISSQSINQSINQPIDSTKACYRTRKTSPTPLTERRIEANTLSASHNPVHPTKTATMHFPTATTTLTTLLLLLLLTTAPLRALASPLSFTDIERRWSAGESDVSLHCICKKKKKKKRKTSIPIYLNAFFCTHTR